MGEIRTNSEKKLETKSFVAKVGTTNRSNPIVIYVSGKAFIAPNFEKSDYCNDLNDIRKLLKRKISSSLKSNKRFDDKFISDFKIASSGVSYGKKSFMSFQFMLRQNSGNILPLNEVKSLDSNFFNEIIDSLENDITSRGFSIYKTKK